MTDDPAGATPGITHIGQIALTVKDLKGATGFYRDVLGLPFLFDAPNMAFFRIGNLRLMLGTPGPSAEAPVGNSILYYQVPDIHAAARVLEARGVTFVGAPHLVAKLPDHDLWMAFLADPERNTVALMSEVRPPVAER